MPTKVETRTATYKTNFDNSPTGKLYLRARLRGREVKLTEAQWSELANNLFKIKDLDYRQHRKITFSAKVIKNGNLSNLAISQGDKTTEYEPKSADGKLLIKIFQVVQQAGISTQPEPAKGKEEEEEDGPGMGEDAPRVEEPPDSEDEEEVAAPKEREAAPPQPSPPAEKIPEDIEFEVSTQESILAAFVSKAKEAFSKKAVNLP